VSESEPKLNSNGFISIDELLFFFNKLFTEPFTALPRLVFCVNPVALSPEPYVLLPLKAYSVPCSFKTL